MCGKISYSKRLLVFFSLKFLGGTLLNRFTVLTAAHCIQTEFSTSVNGNSYTIKVDNPYDSKQFAVYIGAYDISFINNGETPSSPTVKMNVYKVIRVGFDFVFNFYFKYIVILESWL
jgi:hypothetical protein